MSEFTSGPALRIAVDANPVTRTISTGTENYAREVILRLPGLAPDLDWTFYASRPRPGLGVDLVVLPAPRLWSQARLPVELARSRPDLFLTLAHVVPEACPVVALQVVHDLAYERFPEAYTAPARAYLRHTTRRAARVCPLLVAVSESTRRDLQDLYGVDPSRVELAPPGIATRAGERRGGDAGRLARLGVRGRFALHVGRVERRKNQLAALAAVTRVEGLSLVCAGAEHDPRLASELRSSPRAIVLGRVSEADRDLLYRNAVALVFPSLYEGWGIPVLEAMQAGLPVVTVRASSLPEVGGEAALYAAGPDDVDGLAAHLAAVAADTGLAHRLAGAGRARAELFTWERTAAGVLRAVRRSLQRR